MELIGLAPSTRVDSGPATVGDGGLSPGTALVDRLAGAQPDARSAKKLRAVVGTFPSTSVKPYSTASSAATTT